MSSNGLVDSKYQIDKDDKNYNRFRKQIDVLNDTSLNLENVVPMLNNTTFNDDIEKELSSQNKDEERNDSDF
jgi:hypothetical protein